MDEKDNRITKMKANIDIISDWKDDVESYYEKAVSLALLLILFTFIVFPKIEVKPYKKEIKEMKTIDLPPEIRQKIKPPEEVKPIIPLTVEISGDAGDEDAEVVETIGETSLDLTKPPPPMEEGGYGKTPKFVIHDENPIPIKKVPPKYPAFAKESGIEGTVIIEAEVFKDGSVGAVVVVKSLQSGPGGLDAAAIEAVKKWKFIPAKNNNQPVAVWVRLPITFSLD
ncbi:MAG: hypothetical protein DRH57_01370 [Candidatus Cloacimonadota bacterium]|nr:MAG: hypothetical protein DRH57_01370 [Candidatus Cloacimonadota bacterium]